MDNEVTLPSNTYSVGDVSMAYEFNHYVFEFIVYKNM